MISNSGVISVSSSSKNRSPTALFPPSKSQLRRISGGGQPGLSCRQLGETEEDDPGEIGELGEEIVRNDMNDLPIEKPKCLSNINMNGSNFQESENLFSEPHIIN